MVSVGNPGTASTKPTALRYLHSLREEAKFQLELSENLGYFFPSRFTVLWNSDRGPQCSGQSSFQLGGFSYLKLRKEGSGGPYWGVWVQLLTRQRAEPGMREGQPFLVSKSPCRWCSVRSSRGEKPDCKDLSLEHNICRILILSKEHIKRIVTYLQALALQKSESYFSRHPGLYWGQNQMERLSSFRFVSRCKVRRPAGFGFSTENSAS